MATSTTRSAWMTSPLIDFGKVRKVETHVMFDGNGLQSMAVNGHNGSQWRQSCDVS